MRAFGILTVTVFMFACAEGVDGRDSNEATCSAGWCLGEEEADRERADRPRDAGSKDSGTPPSVNIDVDVAEEMGEDIGDTSHRPETDVFDLDFTDVGTGSSCPTAVAEARPSGTAMNWEDTELYVNPGETVRFRGTESTDPDGPIAHYEWFLLDRPRNSTARFTPSGAVAEPRLYVESPGEYLVELKVFDEDGNVNCAPSAIIRIVAVPDSDLRVELRWNTPSDADQTDSYGTDLDLHFLHPNGTWNTAPWDIFWHNPEAEWGVPGSDDNPRLDVDDTDGAGPEIVTMTGPEDGRTYDVGVYYFSANGFGKSLATVQIFVQETLFFEIRDRELTDWGTFWHVAAIEWPSGAIGAVDLVHDGFP